MVRYIDFRKNSLQVWADFNHVRVRMQRIEKFILCVVQLLVNNALLRSPHANIFKTKQVGRSEEGRTIKYNVSTTWSDLQMTQSSLQVIFKLSNTKVLSLVLIQADQLSYFWTIISELYNYNIVNIKKIMILWTRVHKIMISFAIFTHYYFILEPALVSPYYLVILKNGNNRHNNNNNNC